MQSVNTETQVKLGAAADYQVVSTQGILDHTEGKEIALAIQNISGAGDVTVRNANMSFTKLLTA